MLRRLLQKLSQNKRPKNVLLDNDKTNQVEPEDEEKSSDDEITAARKCSKEGKYSQAYDLYSRSAKDDNYLALIGLATDCVHPDQTTSELEQDDEQLLKRAIEIEPDRPEAYFYLSLHYLMTPQQNSQGIDSIKQAIKLKETCCSVGLHLHMTNLTDKKKLGDFLKKTPDCPIVNGLYGFLLYEQIDDKQMKQNLSKKYLKLALTEKYQHYRLSVRFINHLKRYLANIYYHQKKYDRALIYYQSSLFPKKDSMYALRRIGNIYKYCRDYKKAIIYYQRGIREDDDFLALINLGNMYYYGYPRKNYTLAIKCFDRAVNNSYYSEGYYRLAKMYHYGHGCRRDLDKAIELYEGAIELDSSANITKHSTKRLIEIIAINESYLSQKIRVSRAQEEEIKQLKEEIEELNYRPGNPGFLEAQEDFQEHSKQMVSNLST